MPLVDALPRHGDTPQIVERNVEPGEALLIGAKAGEAVQDTG